MLSNENHRLLPEAAAPSTPVDPRVKRTRQLLRESLLSLLKEKNFEALSVQDITDRATLNRATFYDHFPDKFALFDDIVSEQFEAVLRARFKDARGFCPEGLRLLIQTVCDFLAQLPSNCEKSPNHKLLDLLTEAKVKSMLQNLLMKWLVGNYPTPETLQLAATITSSSIYAACAAWRKNPQGLSPEQSSQTLLPWVTPKLPAKK